MMTREEYIESLRKMKLNVYLFGEKIENIPVAVPDFLGMTRQQANDTAGKLGIFIQVSGNAGLESTVTVTSQSIAKDTIVPTGTTIRLEFADQAARD